jgi:uncharacterized coiled-coil protein SlyX
VIGPEKASAIIPQNYQTNGDLGRLILVYNGLYDDAGNVLGTVSQDFLVRFSQSPGWFIPLESWVYQKLVAVDAMLATINNLYQSGQPVIGEARKVDRELSRITGRSVRGYVDGTQVVANYARNAEQDDVIAELGSRLSASEQEVNRLRDQLMESNILLASTQGRLTEVEVRTAGVASVLETTSLQLTNVADEVSAQSVALEEQGQTLSSLETRADTFEAQVAQNFTKNWVAITALSILMLGLLGGMVYTNRRGPKGANTRSRMATVNQHLRAVEGDEKRSLAKVA